MACLIKKKIYGKTYYYAGTPKRVNGMPRIVNLRYLGTAESIIQRLTSCSRREDRRGKGKNNAVAKVRF